MPTRCLPPLRLKSICFGFAKADKSLCRRRGLGLEPAEYPARVAFKDFFPRGVVEPRRLVDITLGVIEIMSRFWVDTFHRADHFRGKQNIVGGPDLGEQVDPGLMIDAGVEENVVLDDLIEFRAAIIKRNAAEAAPVKRHGAAAMRNDQLQGRKVL